MIVVWVLRMAASVGNWFLNLLPTLPSITWPDSVHISFPVPLVTSSFVVQLNSWAALALVVFACLASARLFLWFYRLIPFNG